MGGINWLAVVLGAVAFFAVGAIWYSFLFSKAWQREVNLTDEQKASFNMEQDWQGTMARVYRFLGLELAPALPAMAAYQRRTAPPRRRPHHYSLEEFGLTPGRVLDELGDYVRNYDIAIENLTMAFG